jgi:hypothetical protein
MDEHPVRLVVTDDLARRRVTVFFRLLLAIPHYIWVTIWTIGAFFAAIAAWFLTLTRGRMPDGLHEFLSNYVRYLTQLMAYLLLAASPYPTFGGDQAYPIDLELDARPREQERWRVGFRVVLAVPALILAKALLPYSPFPAWRTHGGDMYGYTAGGAAASIAFVAWFACLVRGRMPRGLRDVQAYAIRYAAQAVAYTLLLTDRYPDARPSEPPAAAPEDAHPVELDVSDDLVRSRVTVFFRLLLAVPHIVWIVLWAISLIPTLIVGWVATLFAGQLPASLHRFVSAYLRYQAQLYAFVFLVANPFPGFTGAPGYPVELRLPAEPEPQHRGKTGFRIFLAVPAWVIGDALGGVALVAALLGWFAALATGRMPRGLRDLGAWSLRYTSQADAYLFLVTERYPYSGPYEFAEPPPPEPVALLDVF